jgi:hypothetical protein
LEIVTVPPCLWAAPPDPDVVPPDDALPVDEPALPVDEPALLPDDDELVPDALPPEPLPPALDADEPLDGLLPDPADPAEEPPPLLHALTTRPTAIAMAIVAVAVRLFIVAPSSVCLMPDGYRG